MNPEPYLRNTATLAAAAVVVALPFVFRPRAADSAWRRGDPVLVVISPHHEGIRYEFGRAFSDWHARRYGRPVKVDWRNIGGTTEIMRHLGGEYVAAFRAWWTAQGRPWPAGAGDLMVAGRQQPEPPTGTSNRPDALREWAQVRAIRQAFRTTDDPAAFTSGIDLFFGGGAYDHDKAFGQGLTVAPWPPNEAPPDTVSNANGRVLIPEGMGGETWRTPYFFGTALSTFGICYNLDRLKDLGLPAPRSWEDLADPRYFRQLGVADPTKSGSIAKAFEMIVHEQCWRAVRAAGFSDAQVEEFEVAIARARLPPGRLPAGVPAAYQAAVELGWLNGLRLVQRIGANARYFTDSASKVPIDVGAGNAAAGLAIDFYGRFEAETCRGPKGEVRMEYVTPAGGSSVSADPISLLRGAEHRESAARFIEFVLGEDGQRLWNYRPGTPGGPAKFALHRLPIRADFYPSDDHEWRGVCEGHGHFTLDPLGDPAINPYALARRFTYQPRWTGAHFSVQRDLIRAMCMDAGEELQAAWQAILRHGGPEAQPEAMAILGRMPDRPESLAWASAPDIARRHDPLEVMREWTLFFRENYWKAEVSLGICH